MICFANITGMNFRLTQNRQSKKYIPNNLNLLSKRSFNEFNKKEEERTNFGEINKKSEKGKSENNQEEEIQKELNTEKYNEEYSIINFYNLFEDLVEVFS